MNLIDNSQMAEIDRRAQDEYGIPGLVLMENAGIKLWEHFKHNLPDVPSRDILVIAGKGNNGGDALVFARQAFSQGYNVQVILVPGFSVTDAVSFRGRSETKDPAPSSLWLYTLLRLGVPVFEWDTPGADEGFSSCSCIIDGMFGAGLKGELRDSYLPCVERINGSGKPVVSIDLPSGIGDQFSSGFTAVSADYCLTVEYPKKCCYTLAAREYCGDIRIIPIGFPPAERPSGPLLAGSESHIEVPAVSDTAYKHRRGHCGVFAGGRGTLGAAALSSDAAARSRAGLVSLYLSEELYPVLAQKAGGVMIKPWPRPVDLEAFLGPFLKAFDSLVIGPGFTWMEEVTRHSLYSKAAESGIPTILDAAALADISVLQSIQKPLPWILTPHPGEFLKWGICSRDELYSKTPQMVLKAAQETGCIIVLKSHITWIAAPGGRSAVYDGMNHTLGTGGSGDILAGIIGGFLASGIPPFEATLKAVQCHGKAGNLLRLEKGYYPAEELLDVLGIFTFEEHPEKGDQ